MSTRSGRRRLQVGLIGLGRLGRVYARDLSSRIAETRLVAVADTNAAAAKEIAAECDVPAWYDALNEAERNLEAKRPSALAALRAGLATVRIVAEPSPADVGRLTPPELSSKDRPLLAAALAAHATHFVTGDVADFGPWITRRARLPLQVMTPRQFLTEVRP